MRFPRQRFTRLPDAVLTLGALSAWCGSVPAGPALPVPCAPAACGITGPSQFVTSGSATAVAAQNALTVHQTTNSAILNWSSFNIGAGGSVTFKQPTASSVALNRIFQGSPSQIFGKLNANGQIYLINLDGFLFGATSTVNVGSLLVSSLPLSLTDANFNNGILSPLQSDKPVLDAALDPLAPGVGRASVLDSNGKPVLDAAGKPIPVQIVVQPGAALNAADQGRLLLAGQSVTNGGSLTAPDGQVILAAGTQVFLQADNDPSLRGLVVEVDGTPNTAGAPGNTAWNQLSGLLSAPRGNVTMVGLAVNQDGRISATTSVSANGSIRLEAAGGAANGIAGAVGDQTVASTQGGELTIGPQSQMDILPEVSSGSTAVAAQTQYPSSVTLLGEQVIVQGGSIVAPGGNLTAIAAANPSAAFNSNGSVAVVGSGDQNARVRIDSGTTIDLSGSAASLPVTANLVEAQLRSSELADDPTQRNGPLHGLTVFVDARLGSPPIANLSGEIDNVPQNIAQRTETGGTAIIQSEGNIVFAGGASLNVSGGKTTYAGGILQTTYLVGANGQLYPIATANPLMSYVGVVNPTVTETFDKWGIQNVLPTPGLSTYQPGYVQGAPAGSVQFAAPTMVLQGTLEGSAVNGLYQRTPATAVSGGRLTIGIPGGIGDTGTNPPTDYLSPGVRLTAAPYAIVVADDAPLLGPLTLDMPTSYLTSSGFTATQIYSNYDVQLPGNTPLALPPGSTFTVNASRVDLLSGISDPGGTLSFNNVINVGSSSASTAADRPGVYVGDGVTLDVRGLWTNDLATPNASALPQTWQNGGNISVGTSSPGALLSIGSDVTLHASGGAWMNNSGTLTNGSGGSIALNAGAVGGGLDAGAHLAIDAFGVNGAAGGSFTVTAPRVEISTGNSAWTMAQQVDDALAPGGVFQIYSGLFSNYGFQNINVTASGLVAPGAATANVLTVDPGTVISATVSSLELDANVSMRPSAATITGVADVTTLAPHLRPAAAVSLSALPPSSGTPPTQIGSTTVGDVSIGKGASITTDAGGSIALTSLDSIMVDGTLRAPGGAITLHILSPEQLNASNTAPLYGGYEAGFLPNQQIQLGASSTVDVSGTLVSKPSPVGLDLGTIYAGGTVNLFADRGAVVTDAGSLISVAGVSAAHDTEQPNGVYAHEVASSAAGSIAARSGESISLRGDIEAAAGSAGTSGLAAAGSLDVELTRSEPWWSPPTGTIAAATFNPEPLTVQLMPSVPSTAPSLSSFSNQAWLGATQISQSGLDALRLESGNDVEFSAGVALSLGRQLVIDAPVIAANVGANANLSAPYVQIGYELAGTTPQNTNAALGGTGTLSFSGSEVDLVGTTAFQGASAVHLTSSGDMVLRGEALGAGANTFIGGLTVVGNLTLDAARIYPATATSYAISAQEDPTTGIPGIATIGQSSPNPGTPLSGGGALSITAYTVSSTGTLYAPFGTISLDATHALILGDGSLTSVSGGGLIIPFGETQFGGAQWIYGAYNGNQTVGGVPDRAVNLTSPSVTLTKQATIDLSGGGDLSAFEWVPGPGGSRDALAPAAVPGLYAILPSTRGQAAPQDPQNNDPSIGAAQSVYLSGGGGLAAGTYPLLPARYALAPGAFLIEVEPQFQSTNPGFLGALANGTPVVAGFFSYGSTGLHQSPGYTGFAVYPGSYGSELAAYNVSLASNFFSAAATATGAPRPTLPADAGTLSINVGNALDVVGEVLTKASNGGLAAPIDISAADLVIGTPAGPVPADAVSISGSVLSSWQPGSLVLGGKMDPDTANAIDVIANTVTVGSGTTLTAGQIILVANQSVDVQNGASLQSTSAANGSAPVPLPPQQSIALIGSSGTAPGFLAVSDLNWLIPLRIGGTSPIGAATVAIDAGASIASRGSLSIDGLGGVTLNGTVGGPGAQWSLGSSSIAFVPSAVTADALSLNPALVAQLGSASAVRLASTGSIDFLTPTSLGVGASGTPTLTSLTLEASSLNNLTGTGGSPGSATTRLDAQTLMLEGSGASGSMPVAGPAGATLLLTAGELDVGPDTLSVNGFAATRADVSGAVIGKGAGGLSVGGDLTIASHGVTAATAAVTTINATGALSITSAVKGSAGKVPQLLGGTLILSGSTVDISGNVTAPAGGVTLAATHDLTVDSGATISTAGTLVSIGNQLVGTSGGSIAITAGDNLALNPGSLLDVSGAGTAAGGSLSLAAGGSATLGSTMRASGGSGGTGATGGSFSLDAGTLAAVGTDANPLTTLATALAAGNFNDAVDLRVHTGDLHLDAGSTLSANAVTLTADTGEVTVGGEISAPSGALRGTLSIFGGSGVELASGGALHADGGGPTGLGGTIEIGTGQLIADQTGTLNAYNGGSISLDSGSTISTAGAAGEGNLLLRAPALLASNDVAITTLASDMTGIGQIIVEPVLPFNTASFSSATAPTANDFQNVNQTVGNFMSLAQPKIAARLGSSGVAPLVVEAGVEIVALGALTLQSADGVSPALDLSSWRFNGAPVDFTVRAAGDLTIANTLTDGFGAATVGGVSQPILLAGPSSSIRLVAGADLASANPLAVISAGSGNLTIGTPNQSAVVRTGTGTIDLIAANDIAIEGEGSGAYTAGTPAIAPGGNAATPYINIPRALGAARAYGIVVPQSGLLMSFPTGGGNLVVSAGEDITTITPGSPASSVGGVTNWQLREGGNTYQPVTSPTPLAVPVEWGVNLAAYNWAFGSLGGGDVSIAAGRDVINVSAAAADSLLPPEGGGTQFVSSGGLSMTAGRNIGSVQVYLADGTGTVTAGGALTAVLPSINVTDPNVGSGFYLQSSTITVTARTGMAIDGIFNPTGFDQPNPTSSPDLVGNFLTLGANSALTLESAAGDINLGRASDGTQTLLGANVQGGAGADVVPASLSLEAPGGNISIGTGIGAGGTLALYPSSNGQLDLLAAQNIVAASGNRLIMSDAAPGSYATVANPLGTNSVDSTAAQFNGDLHSSDTAPALVTAGGSIEELTLSIPKAAQVVAGLDVLDLTYSGQNLNLTDQTVIAAGRNVSYADSVATSGFGISVGGPGSLDILAGRNVSLGFSQGAQTSGNLLNANLPTAQGADLTIATGLGTTPNFANFLTKIIAPSPNYQAQLISYVESLQGSSGLSFAAAQTAFEGLTPDEQRPLVDKVFFNELSLSGLADNAVPGAGFSEGYAAIDALYPGSRTGTTGAATGAYAGDLTLNFSKIYTLSGGDINLLVPGGLINVGLANPPATFSSRSASTLGIVAEGTGDVDIYSLGDVNVNSSRIFTLGGGNILIWSDEGSIDAGLGAKTSVSAPPPSILISSNGTVSLDFSGAATGSGIRTIQTEPDTPAGNVDLIAPVGTVNAGDAGIGASGNINIAALSVIGVGNIQFGGTATGVPAQVSNIGASLSGASNAASGATTAATSAVQAGTAEKDAAAPLAQTALSWLDVFVTGLGEENCKPDDIDCLRRQKTPTR